MAGRGGWPARKDPNLAARDKTILDMARDNYSHRAIAERVGLSRTRVTEIIHDFYYEQVLPSRDEARKAQVQRLEDYRQETLDRLKKKHIVVQHGRVVRLKNPRTGEVKSLEDDGAALACIDRLLKIEDQLARMQGTHAPVEIDNRVLEVTQQDLEIQELIRNAEVAEKLAKGQLVKGCTDECSEAHTYTDGCILKEPALRRKKPAKKAARKIRKKVLK